VYIPSDPIKESFICRNLIEFKEATESEIAEIHNALDQCKNMRNNQDDERKRLTVSSPEVNEDKQNI